MNNKKVLIIILVAISITVTGCSEANAVLIEDAGEEALDVDNNIEEIDAETNIEEDITVGIFEGYKLIKVDGGDQSGYRESNVVVNIGFGDREYWSFTNEHGQLIRVIAKEIILQNDDLEPVKSNNRYYWDEAKVPGTEHSELDEGHVIADSLGGVSNAYNITPQNSTLNRHGEQAYMEKVIRQAGGCTNFEANITYPDTKTQIPSFYSCKYEINGDEIIDEFENINPEEANEALGLYDENQDVNGYLSIVDTSNNGRVTIKEAKEAGYKMPITSDHWLYEYMHDGDGDGMVGE